MTDMPLALDRLSGQLGVEIVSAERASSSGNSRIYRLRSAENREFAAKLYFQPTIQGRDRLEVEFEALSHMWDNGLRCVPQPFVADREHHVAVYEFVAGDPVPAPTASAEDVKQVVRFASALRSLSACAASESLPPAAEACFSTGAIIANIKTRLHRLRSLDEQGPTYDALTEYLHGEFEPALTLLEAWAARGTGSRGTAMELPRSAQTLSPSDFGFHNTLRRSSGELVFLDFEYFGWDDPAKMIADFLLHPAMALDGAVKAAFAQQMLEEFSNDPALAGRLTTVYPLFGLKWCMILLNEFVPRDLERRRFAAASDVSRGAAQTRQLDKARALLQRVMSEFERFPYLAQAA